MPAPAAQASAGHSPLLPPPSADSKPARSWLQRAAARPLPDPGVVLLVFAVVAGCLCILSPGTAVPAAESAGSALALASTPILDEGPPGIGSLKGKPTAMVAMGAFVTLVWLVACQLVCDLVFTRTFRGALRALDLSRLGLAVQAGPLHSCFFRGRAELRHCIVHNPRGYANRRLAHVRVAILHFDVWRLFASLGRELAVRSLSLDGVAVTLDGSNVQELLDQLGTLPYVPSKDAQFSLRKVTVTDLSATAASGPAVEVGPITHQDFSTETGSHSIERALAALASEIGRAALAVPRVAAAS